jgi:hypothetical protein
MPARSVLTVTPFTAVTLPTLSSVGCHSDCFATSVVTAVGGGSNAPDLAIVRKPWICVNFTNPKPDTTARNRPSKTTKKIRYFQNGFFFIQNHSI